MTESASPRCTRALVFTEQEISVLTLVLKIDLDALGLDPKLQPAARSALRKIQGAHNV